MCVSIYYDPSYANLLHFDFFECEATLFAGLFAATVPRKKIKMGGSKTTTSTGLLNIDKSLLLF